MGAGAFPAGDGPAGHDPVPDPSGAPPIRSGGAIWYDGAARDFLIDARGGYRTLHFVDQKVALALVINQGDVAAVPELGSRLRRIRRGSAARLQAEAEDAVRLALADLLDRRQIEILAIDVQSPARGKLYVAVRYRNLLLPAEQPRTVTASA